MDEQARDQRTTEEVWRPVEARIERAGERWVLVMQRSFGHPPQRLWRMLTDPAELARWSPVVPDRPLTTTGPASSRENPDDDPVDAEVLVADAPRVLVHRWGGDLLLWTVTANGEGAVLELRQTFDDRGSATLLAAGWQVCLGRLAAEDGTERERPTGQRAMAYGWQALREHYESEFAASEGAQQARATAATFRGVFLTSANPEAAAAFYRDVAGLLLETVGEDGGYRYWRLDRDGVQLAIHDAGAFADYTDPPNPASNLTHLYFTIDNREAFLAHLADLGLAPVATDDVVVTLADPDGRQVMFGTA